MKLLVNNLMIHTVVSWVSLVNLDNFSDGDDDDNDVDVTETAVYQLDLPVEISACLKRMYQKDSSKFGSWCAHISDAQKQIVQNIVE